MFHNYRPRQHGFRRLYLQIYLTVAVSLVLVVAAAGVIFRLAMDSTPASHALEMASVVIMAALPAREAGPGIQKQALTRLARDLKVELALFDAALQPLAVSHEDLPAPDGTRRGWWRGDWSLRLPDERWLVVRMPRERHAPPIAWLVFLLVGALAVALAAWPLVRRLTRRLERLQQSVEALGAGDLSARVRVEGRDEIASLAASFNRAAARIETLMSSHRMLLANTSHELRTPLARIRMGMELLDTTHALDPKRRAELEQDIAEIDNLIEEILLASRLDAVPEGGVREEVDLLALAAEEASRQDSCGVEGEALTVQGDARLLRRMVRNILENARRYGAPPVSVRISQGDQGRVELRVRDHGPGVPQAERERIFEPFYRVAGAVSSPPAEGYMGTGLGLSLVRRIARHHGGEARCEAVEGPGTCIVVSLPPV
ncbi:MAG: HAMP domain-containing histidine kinase [Betaproteobacteria bacterium]|nr:HAMP domain-containing histidine kinase [Betaproteobacteria bacterium]